MDIKKDVKNFLDGISENCKAYFCGSTEKNALEYGIGEKITFKIRVKTQECFIDVPYISYELYGDDGKNESGFIHKSDDGWFYIDTSLDKEGFVHLIAKACDDNKNEISGIDVFEGGAGAGINKLVCGTDTPDDYFEFWDWLKKETYKTEPEILFCEEFQDESAPDYKFYDMRIKTTESMYASCIVIYPKDAQKGSLKLVMNYIGYGVSPLRNCKPLENAMSVYVSTHSIPSRESDEFYNSIAKKELKEYGFSNAENAKPETTYWAGMFMRNMQALRYFKDNSLLNKKEYIFFGGSQGAMQACNMALHSGIATDCIIIVPWMADLGGNEKFGRLIGWRPDYTNGIRYFDTAVAAKFLKCPVTIMAGLGDYVCPPSGQMAMYNGITAPKKIVFVQNQTHPYRPYERITYSLGSFEGSENYEYITGSSLE